MLISVSKSVQGVPMVLKTRHQTAGRHLPGVIFALRLSSAFRQLSLSLLTVVLLRQESNLLAYSPAHRCVDTVMMGDADRADLHASVING